MPVLLAPKAPSGSVALFTCERSSAELEDIAQELFVLDCMAVANEVHSKKSWVVCVCMKVC